MRQIKTIYVCSANEYEAGYPPCGAGEFMLWLAERIDEIPEQHRDTAKVNFCEGDSGGVECEIYYKREETDDEMADREAREGISAKQREAEERRMLAALRAKYGE